MNKKKILFINASLSNGGSERVMVLLANELSLRGYNVEMIVLGGSKTTYIPSEKIKIIKLNTNNGKTKIQKRIQQVKNIRNHLKSEKYDTIISFMEEVNVITLLSSYNLNCNVIISERCNPKTRKKGLWYYLSMCLYKYASKIVIQTEQVRSMLFKNVRNKCFVIPNPVNIDIPLPYVKTRRKVIIAAGRLTDQKNFHMLIDGFSEFSKKHKDYMLEIYGVGPLLEELKSYAVGLNLQSKIEFKGFVNNLNDKMNSSTMYVSTSNYEGISNTMIEAMAMGVPTVCTDCPVGGASLMIRHEENGVLIPVGDTQKLIYYMNKIVEDDIFRNKISNNSIEIKDTYSIQKIVDKWEKIL